MDTNPNGMKRLLAAVLDSQIEPEQNLNIDQERLRQALTSGPPLNTDEQRRIWSSPLTRAEYLSLKRQINAEIRIRWRERDFELRLIGRAAADGSDELRYDSSDGSFQITLMRQPDEDMPWLVLLTLSTGLRETLYPSTELRLIDSGGLEWVRGQPDTRGEISFGWYDLINLPDQRLREYTLVLEIV